LTPTTVDAPHHLLRKDLKDGKERGSTMLTPTKKQGKKGAKKTTKSARATKSVCKGEEKGSRNVYAANTHKGQGKKEQISGCT